MLRDTQVLFADSLLQGSNVAAPVVHGGGLTPERRLEIYRHNVMHNLRGALRDIFPVTERIVGEFFFSMPPIGSFVKHRRAPAISTVSVRSGRRFWPITRMRWSCRIWPIWHGSSGPGTSVFTLPTRASWI